MSPSHYFEVLLFFLAILFLTPVMGTALSFVLSKPKVKSSRHSIEKFCFKLFGISQNQEMTWKDYLKSVLVFNSLGFILLVLILMNQTVLPLNPDGLPNLSWHLAFNTAMSFITNTNWQSYGGESTMSHFSQMVGLGTQNFLSAATGIAVLLAIIRGLTSKQNEHLGNFWEDLFRSTFYILLPLSIVLAIFLMSQGVVQSFDATHIVKTLEGVQQKIAVGPAASQIAIKQLGTNGGGFFNANSAHPFENPTPLSNFLEMISILIIPAGLVYLFGIMQKNKREAWTIFGVMFGVLATVTLIALYFENAIHPSLEISFLEGKETRFGSTNSTLWAMATTAASNGSVNAMHSSFSPLASGLAILNMLFGEVIFGGVGSGLYGMFLFCILTVFLAGLMVGRTPEYLGKKIEGKEMTYVIVGILAPSAAILFFSTLAFTTQAGLSSLLHKGSHAFSEIFYTFTSASANNGSAFAGLNANTPFYNVTISIAMLIGRFGVIIPALAVAGSMSKKKVVPKSSGTFPTDSLLFGVLLCAVIVIVGALTFFPSLSLGPILEHLLLMSKQSF